MYKTTSRNVTRFTEKKARKVLSEKRSKSGAVKQVPRVPQAFIDAFNSGKILEGEFLKNVKGGVLISFGNYNGFCPYKERYPKNLNDKYIEKYRGKFFHFVITKATSSSLVVSRKKAAAKEALYSAKDALAHDGFIYGQITSSQPFGLFVDIGGLEGLVHKTEIPENFTYEVGKRLKVKILELDEVEQKISLSMAHF